jgi:succinate dehydrogenase / fumarate reductase cytochrome b subunit
MAEKVYPRNWLGRRWHSILGLWLVIYIIEHLLTNSQAALFIGNDGGGYIRAVNAIHNLPYLPVIEIVLVGLPFLFHALWGIAYAINGRFNSVGGDGRKPRLPRYARNHAYSWQRIASWIILVGVILHVIQMRFVDYPHTIVTGGDERLFLLDLPMDEGLYTVAARMGVPLFDQQRIEATVAQYQAEAALVGQEGLPTPAEVSKTAGAQRFDPDLAAELELVQQVELDKEFVEGLLKMYPKPDQVVAVSDQFGKVSLLNVRSTFRDPWMILLYTIFVIAAVYHGFRGLWSFTIVWGLTLTPRSQQIMSQVSVCFMVVLGFLGLSAVWLTYWVNLRA